MPSIAFHTLGCKLNFAESSHLLRGFKERGFSEKSFHEKADVYVVNTCTVTAVAEKKCRAAIRQAYKLNNDAVIAVIGCFSQVNAREIEKIEGVNIILGNDDKNRLIDEVFSYMERKNQKGGADKEAEDSVDITNNVIDISHLKTFSPSMSFDDRTRGFLKVQDGCDYFCSYCEIPFARGRSRSCSVAQAVESAKMLAKEGKKEIVLTGVNIGDFGKGTSETFFDLVKALDDKTDVQRYRISSIEPDLLSKEIIDFCAQSRSFMPHFHIPLQSGSNKVLENMNRHYRREDFAMKVNYIRSVLPNAFIACDVMTGFNGETEEEFLSAYSFLESLPIAFIHVFTYSDRPDTKAYRIAGKVPVNERRKRSEILQKLSESKKRQFYQANIGYKASILWEESEKDGMMSGFSDNYIRAERPFEAEFVNTVTKETLCVLNTCKDAFVI
ncbi:MAG: tRNA (N(6)-L-threonylcarbamoyladenosine(37)-C(2))-methylthiotransferase MtaB [Bacteroidales bacterium]|nr:tRNA (N(6)-L-threonylcarbamoyladenosine(37)-C(2))-methylthiotransferase MtaB [Bacteroidales bacterium]